MSHLVGNPEDRVSRVAALFIPGMNTGMMIVDVKNWYKFRKFCEEMSHLVGKPTMWFLNRSDTNRTVQAQKRARSLKFRI